MIQMPTNKRYQIVQDIQTDIANISYEDSFSHKLDNNSGKSTKTLVPNDYQHPTQRNSCDEGQLPQQDFQDQYLNQKKSIHISAEHPGELTNAQKSPSLHARKSAGFLDFLHSPALWAKIALVLIPCSFLGLAVVYQAISNNSSINLSNNSDETYLTENTLDNSFLENSTDDWQETSADWHIQIYIDLTNVSFTDADQEPSKIGLYGVNYANGAEASFALWNLEQSPSEEILLAPLSHTGLAPLGQIEFDSTSQPILIDRNRQLKTLNVLTGETSLMPNQQKFSSVGLDVNSSEAFIVNATKSFAYHIYDYDAEINENYSPVKVWDIKTAKPLVFQKQAISHERNWPLLSREYTFPFSPDGHWMLIPNGVEQQFELWDLRAKQKVKAIDADSVSFSSNKDISIIEEKNSLGEVSQVKLLDLNTQEYILQSSDIKTLALHPHKKIGAIFDGNKLSINPISSFGDSQGIVLGDYPTLQNLKFSPDGRILAGILGADPWDAGKLIFWDTETGKVLEGPQQIGGWEIIRFPRLQFSPDSRKMLMQTMGNGDANGGKSFIQVWQVPQP
ncbi:MAG: hypothetical protein F6K11_24545 [Leptolyngbya sp. SIO3F4]|nr:hypothetical protein [Leptolyngbya sp. SIO3F4]